MAWIPLKPAHIDESFAAAELQALRTLQLEPAQKDVVLEAIKRTTYEVRGYVAAYQGKTVGEPGTVPEELLSAAIVITRWRLLGRLPVKAFATENRRKEYEDAVAQLRDVASGKFAIGTPEEPAEEQPRPPADGAWGGAKQF